ncbi:AraC family transcriptional regulator [Microvirga massiliensis]|uniref:AraC family transcriptional regulator n=1 Tax=Microvirga massiliensis TaxID=1033741 RepID=UPI0009E4634F|nr:AraC family transcriptional regulator [Microvirga massiliensis]
MTLDDTAGPLSASIGQPDTTPSPSVAVTGPGRSLPPGSIHLGVAKEIVPVLHELGFDPDPVIRAAGLDPALFDDGANVIPFAALGRLLTLGVAHTRCPHLGLLVGQRATILSLGLVGRLMLHSVTVGDALRALVANLSIQNRGAVWGLAGTGDTALFSYSIYQPEVESTDQIADGSIAVAVNALRALCGPEWNPTEVLLPRVAPADREPYRRCFRAPVRFDQEIAALVFPARDLEHRVSGADPVLRAMLAERIQHLTAPPASELADHIRRLLRTRLTRNRCSAEAIAELLKMHRRTLTRHLKDSGMGYRALANEVRFEIARQLLEDTEVPLGQIAAALGYSEASAFTRAFRRWSGQTPTAWRADGREDGLSASM